MTLQISKQILTYILKSPKKWNPTSNHIPQLKTYQWIKPKNQILDPIAVPHSFRKGNIMINKYSWNTCILLIFSNILSGGPLEKNYRVRLFRRFHSNHQLPSISQFLYVFRQNALVLPWWPHTFAMYSKKWNEIFFLWSLKRETKLTFPELSQQ